MRRDLLAAGAKSATFAGGMGDTDYSRNLYKGPAEETTIIPVEVTKAPRKKFIPLGKTVLVRRAEAKTPSGILLADTVQQDKPAEGIVLAAGPDAVTVKPGQDIAFGRYAGAEFPLNGETLLLMSVTEILGILEDEIEPEEVTVIEAVEEPLQYDMMAGTVVAQA